MAAEKMHIADVSRAASSLLSDLGFVKHRGDIFTRSVDDGVVGWLGLNRAVARGDGMLEINPVVGVRHQQLERLVATLGGREFHPYIPPTASVHLGYLMPERRYVPWLFSGSQDAERVARQMVSAITDYGLPFIEHNVLLENLVATLESGGASAREQLAYRVPIAYLLIGDVKRSREALDRSVTALGERRDAAAEALRSFAPRLQERLRVSAPV